ncbi:glycosyltransferase [Acidianus manzaensis]|uniref:Glycosyl transferase family 2 n=1 Tax=Acidianus manzaensis TaxID=282676 RepID=A0A1W6JWK6_9CREN|nr:glycosyltransferase [Acidianus manzaensis]ARM74643.1 glycosyl transferase family 2 [Acidianus manzaensis]
MLLDLIFIGLLLIVFHFVEPVYYFKYVSGKRLDISRTLADPPHVSIIVPTYNEGDKIVDKIKNILESYPKDYMEILVVDASNDNTVDIVKSLNIPQLRIIKEEKRRGKIFAVKEGIKMSKYNIVIITDADAFWKSNLFNAVKYLTGSVGAVSCIKTANNDLENAYRSFYNLIRLGESAIFSSPIFHGEMTAFRKDVLNENEIPNVGADDSTIATLVSLKGYRAICVDNMLAYELAPKDLKDYISWKMRRGSHLIRLFLRFIRPVMRSNNKKFKEVFLEEFYLHLINPWILVLGIVLLFLGNFILALGLIGLALIAYLVSKRVRNYIRAWIPNQFFLILAQIFSLKGEVLAWKKEKK